MPIYKFKVELYRTFEIESENIDNAATDLFIQLNSVDMNISNSSMYIYEVKD